MTSTNAIAATALAGILLANGAGAVQAADAASTLTMKPLHGVSFAVGTKRAVGYFLSNNGRCELVLTLADAPKWDEPPQLTATRFETTILAGGAARYNSSAGQAIEFACEALGQSMRVNAVEQVAASAAR
jgi:hypothetical protein